VVGLDNFSTGHRENLEQVRKAVGAKAWKRFKFYRGDIRSLPMCQKVCKGVDVVLHQAALGSVPRSIDDPIATHENNVTGFLNVMVAARDNGVKRVVYAASSAATATTRRCRASRTASASRCRPTRRASTWTSSTPTPLRAATTRRRSACATSTCSARARIPTAPMPAVIPKWIAAMLRRETVYIYGDGETFRDFCYIDNVVQANLLAATTTNPSAHNEVYNVAVGDQTSLNELFGILQRLCSARVPGHVSNPAVYLDFRPGDVRYSRADIGKAQRLLGYAPTCRVQEGLERAFDWYVGRLAPAQPSVPAPAAVQVPPPPLRPSAPEPIVPMAGGGAEAVSPTMARMGSAD
jgi:UDP-N-acetylglucosamine 4-epimerase